MTDPVTSLSFWSQPMLYSAGRFWLAIAELRITVSIYEATPQSRCYWMIGESGSIVASAIADDIDAARDAAQAWLENRAELTREFAAKGRAA